MTGIIFRAADPGMYPHSLRVGQTVRVTYPRCRPIHGEITSACACAFYIEDLHFAHVGRGNEWIDGEGDHCQVDVVSKEAPVETAFAA